MGNSKLKHYALIPAKKFSGRCKNKNWRIFIDGRSIVDFTLGTIPEGIFEKIIVSTDNKDYKAPKMAVVHRRDKRLAARGSCVKDLIELIMKEYGIRGSDYLWLLNPTSPFKARKDYHMIRDIIEAERPPALVSAIKIIPYIWKNDSPQFTTAGKRRNTDDFGDEYAVENGMFYVMRAAHFSKNKSWYGRGVRLYKLDDVWSSVDIDTEKDFRQAQEIGRLWKKRGKGHAKF